MKQQMSKSNPIGRAVINPMVASEYTNRHMQLLIKESKPITSVKYAEKEIFYNYFLPLLAEVDKADPKYNFDNTTFYHFTAPEDVAEKDYHLNTLTRLPFEDIAIVLHGGILTPNDRAVVKFKVKSRTSFIIGLYLIDTQGLYKSPITTEYDLVEETTLQYITESYLKHLPLHNRTSLLKAFESYAVAMLHNFIDMYEAYEPVLVDNDLPDTLRRAMANVDESPIAGRSEFVFDLTKPRPKNKRESTGTHKRPCEHIRRPHKRTIKKTGQVIWIGQRTINKGVGKSVKKEYKL